MPPEQVILFIIGTVVILFGAYYVTYFVGMKATGQKRSGLRNRSISLLDRFAIARDKQFCIIEIAGKVYIVGVTNHTMALLDTLDAAAFAQITEETEDTATPWNMTPVGQYGNKLTRKLVAFVAEKTGKTGKDSKTVSLRDTEDEDPENRPFEESLKEAKRAADGTDDTDDTDDADDADDASIKTQDAKSSDNQPENPEDNS